MNCAVADLLASMKYARTTVQRVLPLISIGLALVAWELAVTFFRIRPFILPTPSSVFTVLWNEFLCDLGTYFLENTSGCLSYYPSATLSKKSLVPAFFATITIALKALGIATISGLTLSIILSYANWIRLAFTPYIIILQVTPAIVIAPYIAIYIDNSEIQLITCAWILSFFPILNNTTAGLIAPNRELQYLFKLYGASHYQTFLYFRFPNALPHFFCGLKVSCGLALTGTVVAELIIGTSGRGAGLAHRIVESSYRLDMQYMMAATVLLSASGLVFFAVIDHIAKLALRDRQTFEPTSLELS